MVKLLFGRANSKINCYDEAADAAAAAKAAADAAAGAKMMTQAEIDSIVTKRTEQARSAQKATLQQLETLQGTLTLNEQEKATLAGEIDELRKRTMTAEEIAKRELKQKETEYTGRLTKAEKEAADWKTRHHTLLIDAEISSAAAKAKVIPGLLDVVSAYLKPTTRLVEEKDVQGNVVRYSPIVDFNDIGADGKPVVSTLPIPQVIDRMKQLPAYYSLFEGSQVSGAGAGSGVGQNGKKIDPSQLNQQQYMELRKTNPQAIYGAR